MSILKSVFPFLEWILQTSDCCSGSKNDPTFGACASKRVDSVNWKYMEAFFISCVFCMSLVKKRKKWMKWMVLFRHLWFLGVLWKLQHWAGYGDFLLLSSEAGEATQAHPFPIFSYAWNQYFDVSTNIG